MKYLPIFLLVLVFAACKKDPEIIDEPELITTVIYTLTPTDSALETVVFKFQDIDGEDGMEPVIEVGELKANSDYIGDIRFLNESVDPVDMITEEILEEANEHQLFYKSSLSSVVILYTDTDSNNLPVGLGTTLSTLDAGSGQLKITLVHEPEKNEANVSIGDITNAGGEIDIEVSFDINVVD